MPGIVVGVDGSPNSERALDWAMKQAAAVQAPLTVIAVHEVPKSYWGNMPVIGQADEVQLENLRQAAEPGSTDEIPNPSRLHVEFSQVGEGMSVLPRTLRAACP